VKYNYLCNIANWTIWAFGVFALRRLDSVALVVKHWRLPFVVYILFILLYRDDKKVKALQLTS